MHMTWAQLAFVLALLYSLFLTIRFIRWLATKRKGE